MIRNLLLSFFVICSATFVANALAAGFDCSKAAGNIERAICADPQLSSLDTELADLYTEQLREAADKTGLQREQREWLKKRDRCLNEPKACQDTVENLYLYRVVELRSRSSDDNACSRGSGPEMATCLGLKAAAAERDLASLISEMKAKLEDPNAELLAQSAWEQYRDKECESRASLNGSWGGMQIAECRLAFTRVRIKELREVHFSECNGCPGRKQ